MGTAYEDFGVIEVSPKAFSTEARLLYRILVEVEKKKKK
jgi:hypothetical protein